MTTGRIDVHSHLVPAVDDGCRDYAESVACARRMVDAGYTHSFCTPHFWPNLPDNTPANNVRRTAELQEHLRAAGVPLTLVPGGEINLRPDLDRLALPDLPTLGMRGRYALVDFWCDCLPTFFEPTIRWMQSLGLTVIVAHPERVRAVQADPTGVADYFRHLGMLLQGNLQCLSDPAGHATRAVVEQYLKEDRYFLLGSDLHRIDTLPCRLDGLRAAIELVGPDAVDRLTRTNPRLILDHALSA